MTTTRFTSLGNLDLLTDKYHKIGIIGSREVKADDLMQAGAQALVSAENGKVVVTGMAAGIDTIAMIMALTRPTDRPKNQKHIAVIPSINCEGIPANNKILIQEIQDKGGLVIAPEDPLIDFKTMYLRRNDLLLEIINELITVGELGKGASYTQKKAIEKQLPIKNVIN